MTRTWLRAFWCFEDNVCELLKRWSASVRVSWLIDKTIFVETLKFTWTRNVFQFILHFNINSLCMASFNYKFLSNSNESGSKQWSKQRSKRVKTVIQTATETIGNGDKRKRTWSVHTCEACNVEFQFFLACYTFRISSKKPNFENRKDHSKNTLRLELRPWSVLQIR